MSYTSGDWVVGKTYSQESCVMSVDKTRKVAICPIEGMLICATEQAHNAHLIAQAPKLLETLCTFLRLADDDKKDKCSVWQKAMLEARVVIAKATFLDEDFERRKNLHTIPATLSTKGE